MYRKKSEVVALAAVLALAVGCSHQSSAPTTPTNAASGTANDAADGSTLKVTAPAIISPASGTKLDSLPVTLTVGPATPTFGGTIAVNYEFQLLNPGGTVALSRIEATTSTVVNIDLTESTAYTWRARATLGPGQPTTFGPWSNAATFTTPDKPKVLVASMSGNSLVDPLTQGGSPIIRRYNEITWRQDVGVQLNNVHSFVEWRLQQTLTEGEFSFLATNISNGGGDIKTKIMSMLQDDGVNVTDNAYRMTIDKRPNTNGWNAAVRYTLRSRGTDAGEPNCGGTSWTSSQTYFWKYNWNLAGNSAVTVNEGGINGPIKKQCGTNFRAPYSPNGHLIRLGSVAGRAGDETLGGVIIWNVYVGPGPRPAMPGDK